VSLAVAFSAITGYIVFKGLIDFNLFYTALGVMLLAAGASALNQYQEKDIDALMNRTKFRPIPTGTISPIEALIISFLFCFTGLLVLYFKTGLIPSILALFNILWYNGFYTYLKRKTAFAVVPGSLTGVIPVLIGWTAAGGYLFHPEILFISFFIYMWQIPHFWLLLIKYNDEYKNAGLSYLYQSFTGEQAKRIVFVWIFATSLTSLLLPYFGIINYPILYISVILINLALIIIFYILIFKIKNGLNYKLGFVSINVFLILIMLTLIIEKL